MNALPPLADVAAVRSPDPADLDAARTVMTAGGLTDPWEPVAGWVAASRQIPGGAEPPGETSRRAGLLFAQGADVALTPQRDARALADLATSHPDRLAEIEGDFGFLAFEPRGEATVVRSASGLVPFYVAGSGDRWTITTSLELMLRLHAERLDLDPLTNAIWTSGFGVAPDRRTFLSRVMALGRGEYVRLGDDGPPRFGVWWEPWEGAEPRPADDHAERLRAALIGTLERELDPGGGNLLTLSGGVDSSAVGALAAGVLGYGVDVLTVLPEDASARARDLGYIDALDDAVGLGRQVREEVGAERRIELLDEPAVPFHVLHPYLCLLRSAAGELPVRTLFGGEFADHTLGSTLTLRDWTRHTSAVDLWRGRRELPTGRSDIRRWFTWRLQTALRRPPIPFPDQLPEMIRPEVRAEYDDWFSARRRAAAADDRPLPYLSMFLERQGFLGTNWEICSALGIRRVYPFVTRELLELAFELHPSELVGPGTKRLLRRALAGDVPAENLQRPDKGYPGAATDRRPRPWVGPIPPEIEPILAEGWPGDGELPFWDVFRTRQLVAFARAYGRAMSTGTRHRSQLG